MEDLDFWMGDGRGTWEGDTLVINTVSLGDKTWFDQAGNFHSDALKVDGTLHADRCDAHQLRSDARRLENLHPALEDQS